MSIQSVLIVAALVAGAHSQYQPTWESLDSRPLPQWYDQSKFGIFLHWGVYSVPSYGGEWFWWDWQGVKEDQYVKFMEKNYPPNFTYADFGPMFKAELFDPDEWADLFKAAGAQYVVLTSKHHEGWTNWPSKTSWNWNSVDNGPHVDLVGMLANSIRSRTSIHFGLYFSLFEWFHPLYLNDKANNFTTQAYVQEVCLPQLYEIVNAYKPEVIWSDGDWEASYTYWNSTGFLAWLYNDRLFMLMVVYVALRKLLVINARHVTRRELRPVKDSVVVNDRWGKGSGCQHGGFYDCTDRYDPGVLQKHKWENCMTVDKGSWGYRRDAQFSDYYSTGELIKDLVVTVSCGGNLLLNVGPTHDGRIVPIFEERLRDIGEWLAINGEAIYNTTPWAFQNDSRNSNFWYTTNMNTKAVYGILVTDFPAQYIVSISSVLITADLKISLLGYGPLEFTSHPNEHDVVDIHLPILPLDSKLNWAWAFKLENAVPAT